MSLLRNTVFQPKMILVLSSVFVIGCLLGTFNFYFFNIMADQMHSTQLAMGAVEDISGAAQTMFFFAQTIIDKFGVLICLEAAVASWCILLFLTSCIYNSWLNMIPEVLQGVGVPAAHASMAHYLRINTPREVYTTSVCT